MNLPLDHFEDRVTITMEVMRVAARNDLNGKEPGVAEDNDPTSRTWGGYFQASSRGCCPSWKKPGVEQWAVCLCPSRMDNTDRTIVWQWALEPHNGDQSLVRWVRQLSFSFLTAQIFMGNACSNNERHATSGRSHSPLHAACRSHHIRCVRSSWRYQAVAGDVSLDIDRRLASYQEGRWWRDEHTGSPYPSWWATVLGRTSSRDMNKLEIKMQAARRVINQNALQEYGTLRDLSSYSGRQVMCLNR